MTNDELILLKTANLQDTLQEKCWKGYRKAGLKKKGNRMVPNCVKKTPMALKILVLGMQTKRY